jgi:hypothetical protein
MLPEGFVFFVLPILLANETSAIAFEYMSFTCGIFCRCLPTLQETPHAEFRTRVGHYRALWAVVPLRRSARVLRILQYKRSLLTVISLALGLPRGRRYLSPVPFGSSYSNLTCRVISQCGLAYAVTRN